jgi:hypothetical protein
LSTDLDGVLDGAQAIADYIGKSYRQTVYLLDRGHLPGWKIGHRWYSSKTKLRKRLLGEEEAA